MDGEAVFDAEMRRFVTPAACRLDQPLDRGMKTSQIDWQEYLCPRCLADGVPDPYFRLQKPARI